MLPLYGPSLLKITTDENLTIEIKQNAAIQLKNYIYQNWKFSENQDLNKQLLFDEEDPIIVIKKEDKEFIKSNILQILSQCQTKPILYIIQVKKKIIPSNDKKDRQIRISSKMG